jgi:hypothetical protein
MMTRFAFALLLAVGGGTALAAQSASETANLLTLTGCVQPDETRPRDWFTLSDTKTGITYRLTGPKVKSFIWRNVRIVGGLVPSPNLAAQAGAIDATKAAMASQGAPPSGARAPELPEFRVSAVRPLAGSCSPKK